MATSDSHSPDMNWQVDKPISETNLYMLENQTLCDATFKVGEKGEEVKAHKFMLVSRSPVFYAMFCGPLAENGDTSITIPDVEADSFKIMLRFMYTESCEITGESVMSLLYAAKKYEIATLVRKCSDFLQNQIGIDNVCTILPQALIFDDANLVTKCFSYIFSSAENILQSVDILMLKKDEFRRIIEADEMYAPELCIFTACLRWAKHQCAIKGKESSDENIRATLGDLLYRVRFTNMTAIEFTNHMSDTDILSKEEKITIFKTFCNPSLHQTVFDSKPRYRALSDACFRRFKTITSSWTHNGMTSAIEFKCSENLMLKGVAVFSPVRGGIMTGQLEVCEGDTTVSSIDLNIAYEDRKSFEMVLLPEPIFIKKNVRYNLLQTCNNAATYYGNKGIEEVKVDGVVVKFDVSSNNLIGNNTAYTGQFYSLLFA